MKRFTIASASLLLLIAAAEAAPAETPEQAYDALFGAEAKQVMTVVDRKAQTQFAKKLFDSAKALKDDRPLQRLLCIKAYEFAITRADDSATASAAMEFLAAEQPDQKMFADERLITICERQYRAATPAERKTRGGRYLLKLIEVCEAKAGLGKIDEAIQLYRQALPIADQTDPVRAHDVSIRLKQLEAHQAALKRVADLQEKSRKRPDDRKLAADIVVLLAIELDRPGDAIAYLESASNDELAHAVGLMQRDPTNLNEAEAMSLADWCRRQSEKASEAGKIAALTRAKACYERFIQLHGAEDAQRLKAKLAVNELVMIAPGAIANKSSNARILAPRMFETRNKLEKLPAIISEQLTVGGPDVLVSIDALVTVVDKASLTIRPGTLLQFGEKGALDVSGTLVAVGEPDAMIVFTAKDARERWPGLDLNTAPKKKLAWCVICKAQCGIKLYSDLTIENCAFVQNRIGINITNSTGLKVSDTVIYRSIGDGVIGIQDQGNQWTNVTISDGEAIGYHGTFKGWPVMKLCVITNNKGGGLKCEVGGGTYRGKPEVSDSDIHGNGGFDIFCDQPESYTFSNVFVGAAAGRKLKSDSAARVPNIIDGRSSGKNGKGIVSIREIRTEPVTTAGAPMEMLKLAEHLAGDK